MDLWRSVEGLVQVRLISADITAAMAAVSGANIETYEIHLVNELTMDFTVARKDFRRLKVLAQKRGERLQIQKRQGLYWLIRRLTHRPVLIIGIGILLFLTLFLPTRILFIEIEGNERVEANEILEAAQLCGLGFGSSREELRSEQIKNRLLQQISELQWAGVNTYGCRAVISVRERPTDQLNDTQSKVTSIVASRDGIIEQVIVQSGNRLCTPGQAVQAGQVLISGYTDCGICIRAGRAEGEVYARTSRSLTAVHPLEWVQRGKIISTTKKYSLLIGKKQINFFKDSGISTPSCDKMYSVNYMTLPGGFRLPVAWVTQTETLYETQSVSASEEDALQCLTRFIKSYITEEMVAGQIRQREEETEQKNGLLILHGDYACLEMISKTRYEENFHYYGESN